MTLIDDFEDGDTTVAAVEWTGWSGSDLTASASAINGSFSGLLSSSNSVENTSADRSAEIDLGAEATLRVDTQTGNASDTVTFEIVDGSLNDISVILEGDGSIVTSEGTTLTPTWSATTPLDVKLTPDTTNNNVDVYIDGSLEVTEPVSLNGIERVNFEARTDTTGNSLAAYIDDVASAGDQLEEPTLAIDATRDTEIDVSATFESVADEVDVYRSDTPGVTTGDTLLGTITSNGGTVTDTGLENGEEYYYAGVAKDNSGTSPDSNISAEVDGITTLPAITIDASDDVFATVDVVAGDTLAIGEAQTESVSSAYYIAGSVENRGSLEVQ